MLSSLRRPSDCHEHCPGSPATQPSFSPARRCALRVLMLLLALEHGCHSSPRAQPQPSLDSAYPQRASGQSNKHSFSMCRNLLSGPQLSDVTTPTACPGQGLWVARSLVASEPHPAVQLLLYRLATFSGPCLQGPGCTVPRTEAKLGMK